MEADSLNIATPARPRLQRRVLFVLGSMTLIDCINVNLLTPYVDEMVSSFLGASPEDPRVETTVGALIGLYSLCEVLCSIFWGWLSDRIGRKPVLLLGLAGSAVAPIVFGLAPSLAVVFIARAMDGFFCGNNGVVKTYLGELVDKSNEARAFSMLAICFSCGLLIGPVLGGELVHPEKLAPSVFAGSVFEAYPYFLPNLTYACLAVIAWIIGALYLEETLPQRARTQQQARDAPFAQKQAAGPQSHRGAELLQSPSDASASAAPQRTGLCQFIMSYSLLSGYYSAWVQNFILLVSLPASTHGFGFGPRHIGMLQNFGAIGLMLTQFLFYPKLTKRFGYFNCFAAGVALNLLATLPFPAYGLLSDPADFGMWRYIPLAVMQFFAQIGGGFCFPTVFVWINRATEGSGRGTANGVATSTGAFFRSISPPLASGLLAIGLKSGVGVGRYLPIYVNAVALIGALACASSGVRKLESRKARTVCSDEMSEVSPAHGA